jgi:small subunit ribosomal protein S4e
LKYALNGREVTSIVKQRLIKVDGKVRTDTTFPTGFMGNLPFLSLTSSYSYAD